MSADKTHPLPLVPVLVCLAAIFLLTAMDASVKGLVLVIGAYNALFWRSIVATCAAGTAWTLLARRRPSAAAMRLHVQRGIVVSFVALAFFWGLGRLPLAEAVALSFIAPLVALFLAAILLGERIGPTVVRASLAGMAGVLVIMAGRIGGEDYAPDALLGMLAIIASAVLYAYNLILVRRQALVAKPLEIAVFQNVMMALVLGVAAPWLAVVPPPGQWWPILGVTSLALAGHFMMSWAYARAEAQYLIPTEYSAFVWAIVLGWLVFGERPGLTTLAGAGLIILGCLLAARARPRLAKPIEVAAV